MNDQRKSVFDGEAEIAMDKKNKKLSGETRFIAGESGEMFSNSQNSFQSAAPALSGQTELIRFTNESMEFEDSNVESN